MKVKFKLLRNPYVRIGIFLFIAVIVFSAAACGAYLLSSVFFQKNKHFILREVKISSIGYWNNRSSDISKVLGLQIGLTNLFDLDLAYLRDALKNQKELGIEEAEVSRELPDSLFIRVYERIPRAVLFNRKSDLLVDEKGVVLNRKYCKSVASDLPIITGFKLMTPNGRKASVIPYGSIVPVIKPALVFMRLVNTEFNEFEISVVNLYNVNELSVFMKGPDNKPIKVLLPFPYSLDAPPTGKQLTSIVNMLRVKLQELKELYRYMRWKKVSCSEINMLYSEQAVVR